MPLGKEAVEAGILFDKLREPYRLGAARVDQRCVGGPARAPRGQAAPQAPEAVGSAP